MLGCVLWQRFLCPHGASCHGRPRWARCCASTLTSSSTSLTSQSTSSLSSSTALSALIHPISRGTSLHRKDILNQCDQIRIFIKDLATFWASLEHGTFNVNRVVAAFWAGFVKIGLLFYSDIWSLCPQATYTSVPENIVRLFFCFLPRYEQVLVASAENTHRKDHCTYGWYPV